MVLRCLNVLLVLTFVTACSSLRPTPTTAAQKAAEEKPVPVIIDHDGGVEDLVAVMLLMLEPRVNLLMVSYVESDSIKEVAVNTTLKIMHFLNITHIPLAVSTLQPKNAFPLIYRAQPLAADVLPALNPPDLKLDSLRSRVVPKKAGQDALLELLLQQKEPVTVIATGPLTNIAYVLKQNPAAADKIARIWWMGGTLRRPGNIFNHSSSDGSAEWNVFADPQAAAVVWASKVPITLVPLDATNKVPITPDLVSRFGAAQDSRLSSLIGSMYAPTVPWVYLTPHDPYYAWDSLNTACFLQPSICTMQPELVSIVLEGPSQAAMLLGEGQVGSSKGSNSSGGSNNSSSSNSSGDSRQGGSKGNSSTAAVLSQPKMVTAAVDADASKFDAFILKAFDR